MNAPARIIPRWALAALVAPAALALAGCHGLASRVHAPSGFVAIFNGRNLDGWRGLAGDPPALAKMNASQRASAQRQADERMRQHWSVSPEGILTFDGGGENLVTCREYADFTLLVDWRIPPGGDSGIYLRGHPQVQIWDNPIGSGGLYNNQQHASRPLQVADRPTGQWNTFEITLVGDRVTVKLNGTLVVNDVPIENYWQRGQPFPRRGSIELQAHGGPLEFRNLFVRELGSKRAEQPAKGNICP